MCEVKRVVTKLEWIKYTKKNTKNMADRIYV